MKFRFSSFLLALLLLVSAQGAFAVATHYSKVADPSLTTLDATDWDTAACGLTAVADPSAVAATDNYVICGSTAGSRTAGAITTLTGTVAVTGTITIESGASVTLSGNITAVPSITINSGGTLSNHATAYTLVFATDKSIVNNGTITLTQTDGSVTKITLSGTGTLTGTGVLNSKCQSVAGGGAWTTPATWGSATYSCGVTAAAASVIPTAGSDVNIDSATTTAVTLITPATVKSLSIEDAGKFTLTSVLTIAGNYANSSAGANVANVVLTGGTLAFTDAPHQITTAGVVTYPVIDLSSFTAARTVTFVGGFATTITSLVLPTSTMIIGIDTDTSGPVVITAVSGNTVTADAAVATAVTIGTTPPIASVAAACTATTGGLTTGTGIGTVSAPIFSTKEKAKVFVEEVNN